MKNAPFAALSLLIALAFAPMQASADVTVLAGPQLPNLTVYGKTYVTDGAGSTVYGNVWSGDVATIGANATVTGNYSSVNASNTGAGGTVGGKIDSGGVTTLGAGAKVAGSVTSTHAATIAAGAQVTGNVRAGGVTTLGDSAIVQGWLKSGDTASIGANAQVVGNVAAVGLISVGANATAGSRTQLPNSPIGLPFTAALAQDNLAHSQMVGSAHSFLASLGTGTALSTTMTTDTTLVAGVYSAASFSTTASTTLYLDGQGRDNQTWVFNITDYLVTGASTKMVLINGGANDSIFWNSGGYAALGATSNLLGTVIATDYISVGANTLVSGLGSSCGGMFSTTSYVSTGAGAIIGGIGCSAMSVTSAVPEPTSYTLMLAGLGLIGFVANRRLRR